MRTEPKGWQHADDWCSAHSPYLQRKELIAFQKERNIATLGYSPLHPVTKTDGPLDAMLSALAKKYYVTPNEILLRWAIDQDIAPITTSSKEQRLSDYLRALAFSLTPKEIDDIAAAGSQKHFRYWYKDKIDENDRAKQ